MKDPTEETRRLLTEAINLGLERERLEKVHTQVWDTDELQECFDVVRFAAPFVVAIRKSDGVKGSLMFQHHPRFYFAFSEN